MSYLPQPVRLPHRVIWTWMSSALIAAVALGLAYGFDWPVISRDNLRVLFLAAVVLFVLSRLLMLVSRHVRVHFRRWWVDYVILIGALLWWQIDPQREQLILRLTAIYSLSLAVFATMAIGLRRIADEREETRPGGTGILLILALCLIIVGGIVLALPVCWAGPYPVQAEHPLARYHLWTHFMDCLFTATAALTGTGLSVLDIGSQFSRVGLWVLVIFMQIGGIGVLVLAGVAGLRLMQWTGWAAPALIPEEKISLPRLIAVTLILMFLFEGLGVVFLFDMWDPAVDPNFRALLEQGSGTADQNELHARFLASTFHSVGAFCNVGLSLPREGFTAYRGHWEIYGIVLPLMVLGSLGGPVFYDLVRRTFARRRTGFDTRVTFWGTLILIVAGAVGLYIFESTRPYQLRYPREKTPGRIHIPTTATSDDLEGGNAYPLPTTAEAETKEEMHAMSQPDLLKASLFQSVAARGGGIRTVRLDEKALTPASRIFLMNLMLVGGGAGGTVSGLRITIFILLLSALFLTRTNTDSSQAPSAVDWKMRRFAALRIAAGVAIALLLLIVLTTLVLAYREAGSFMACLFEATSAVCNNGFSTGMTAGLSIQGKITIILAMLLGRIVPIGLFMRALNSRDIVGKRNDTPGHLLNARPILRE